MGNVLTKLSEKRILIRVDGSHSLGLGHIYRMKTLGLALRNVGSYVAFLSMEDSIANALIKTTGFPCFIFQPESYYTMLNEVIRALRPDLILQDILETSLQAVKTLRSLSSAIIINFDDVGAGLKEADAVINSIVFHYGKYSAENICARLFEGPQYMILQPEIDQYMHLEKPISEQARHLLLAFGATDTQYITEKVLQAISTIDEELHVKINIGPGSKVTDHFDRTLKQSPHQVQVLHAVPNLLEEFYNADLVICAAGNMLYELAALGVPSVSIAAEPHEIYNSKYWAANGTTVSLGWIENLTLTQISETVHRVLGDVEQRIAMSRKGKLCVDNHGIKRVLNILEEILH